MPTRLRSIHKKNKKLRHYLYYDGPPSLHNICWFQMHFTLQVKFILHYFGIFVLLLLLECRDGVVIYIYIYIYGMSQHRSILSFYSYLLSFFLFLLTFILSILTFLLFNTLFMYIFNRKNIQKTIYLILAQVLSSVQSTMWYIVLLGKSLKSNSNIIINHIYAQKIKYTQFKALST